ncbi:MAG: AAA family ATPase [Promethearchaeota archaeon]
MLVLNVKIAVCGKGGVGKTMVSGTLARLLGRQGTKVLAVDADPNNTLYLSLGVPFEVAEKIVPLTENEELVQERTGMEVGRAFGGMFKLNPRVDDLAAKFGVPAPDNVTLLVAGTVQIGGSGCMCPAGALLKALIRHLIVGSGEAFVMDMEAGIENLGRGTTRGMDALIIVVEPGYGAITTVGRIQKLAQDIGVDRVLAVANKVTGEKDRKVVEAALVERGVPLLGVIPLDEGLHEAGLLGKAPLDHVPKGPAMEAIRGILRELRSHLS